MFEGDGNHLRFVAALPSSLGTGIKIQTVELVDDGQGMKSLRVRFSQPSASGERPWGDPQILMRRVANVRFSYRGVDDSNVPTDWLPAWPWSKRLPQLVRVEMDVEGQVKWPGMVVRVRTNMEPAGVR